MLLMRERKGKEKESHWQSRKFLCCAWEWGPPEALTHVGNHLTLSPLGTFDWLHLVRAWLVIRNPYITYIYIHTYGVLRSIVLRSNSEILRIVL